jgi:hypothetical protein
MPEEQKLSFPTIAEQVAEAFRARTKTVALTTLAQKAGGARSHAWPCVTIFHFDDDSSIRITGRGRTHSYETYYP